MLTRGSCKSPHNVGASTMNSSTRNTNWGRAPCAHRLLPKTLVVPVKAIGFELPGSTPTISAERQAENLLKASSSLLLYQSVMKTKAGSNFKALLQNLHRGDPVEHFTELYKIIATEGHGSWQDYLLDQILRITDNAFVLQASKGQSTSYAFKEAVQHDLNVLQELAVADATLATWVKFNAGLSDEWVRAASGLQATAADEHGDDVGQMVLDRTTPHALAPLSKKQRFEVAASIARNWQWSEAAALLDTYHKNYDRGIVSMHSILRWTGTSFQAQDVLEGVNTLNETTQAETLQSITKVLKEFVTEAVETISTGDPASKPPPHTALVGKDDGAQVSTGYRHVLAALESVSSRSHSDNGQTANIDDVSVALKSIRTVLISAKNLSSLPELAWTISQHPRVLFVVVCPWTIGENGAVAELSLILSGDGFSWPSNALFIGVLPGLSAAYSHQISFS